MNLFGWLVPGWAKWAALAAVVALLVGAGWMVNGWRHRAAQADAAEQALADYQKAVSKRDTDHTRDLAAERQRAEGLAADLAALTTAYTDLLGRIPKLPLVTHHDAPPNPAGRCDVPIRTGVFRMCFNAAASGDAAAIAACGTDPGDAAAGAPVPAAGLVRPREP